MGPYRLETKFYRTNFSYITIFAVGCIAVAWGSWYAPTQAYTRNEATSSALSVASVTCEKLVTELGTDIIVLPSDSRYSILRQGAWSQATWKRPACIATPGSTLDVQKLVRLLASTDTPFAIRSGGHSVNPFDSGIDAGVLISTEKFDQTTYDAASGYASMGPGARWDSVYTALDPYNVTVVGGRVMDAGVGGLTLGCGLSYLSDLYGLVCDNIVSYEVVLADGSALEVTSKNHSDLFWALKGGGNNFGIVTQFKSKTYPIKQIWGGMQTFALSQLPEVLQAYYEYQTTPNKDLYANLALNIIPTNDSILITLVYLKPVDRPAAYQPFYNLNHGFEQMGFTTLHDLMRKFPLPIIPRWMWYGQTFTPNSGLLAQISDLFSTAPEISVMSSIQAGTLVGLAQPINENVVLAGQSAGFNALGLKPINQTWFSFTMGWWNADDDAVALSAIESLHEKLTHLTKDAGASLEYRFMNNANASQRVLASYGADNVQRLRSVQRIYDPNLVFQKLVPGGQKIPA